MKGEGQGQSADAPGAPALEGLRIIELGQLLAGPFAGRLLGDLGAEIIKIETPERPDPLREWGHESYEGRSLWWPVQSRNKKSVTLNLREERGQQLFLELVRDADAIVENFRPGTLERWNLGFDQLAAVNPRIVLCRVSGYGQTGPYADRAGFASVAEGMGGLRHITGFPGEPPSRMGISLGDSLAGMFAAQGLLAALYHRDVLGDGLGQVVDVSLLESCFALLEGAVPEYDRLGIVREPHGTSLKGVAPSNIYKDRNGKWVIIAANQDGLFGRLAEAMGQPELATDRRFASHRARAHNQEELDEIIGKWVGEQEAAHLDVLLNDVGVVCGPIYTIADIFDDPHFRARDMLIEHEDAEFGTYIGPGIVPKLSRNPGVVRWSATATPGSHNAEILGDLLGKSEEEIEVLGEEGIV